MRVEWPSRAEISGSRPAQADTPATYRLDGPFAILGRDPRSDLVLPSAQVSRRHAYIQVVGGGLFCIDLESRTKLLWAGEAEPRVHGWLDPGQGLGIGPFSIRWEGNDSRPRQPSGSHAPLACETLDETHSSLLPRAGLEVPIQVGERESLWRMESQVALIGRSQSCQVVLRGESVSRFHASLIRTSKGVWIVDLLAREGVAVNGVKVRWAWLDEGDEVRIGHFTFILRYDGPPVQIKRCDVPLEVWSPPECRQGPRVVAGPGKRQDPRPSFHAWFTGYAGGQQVLSHPVEPGDHRAGGPAWEPAVKVPTEQFAMWRQQMQMMESFHNDMILMVQMFLAMHREHQVSVRDELDRVQKLTGELAVLQEKLAETAKTDRIRTVAGQRPSGAEKWTSPMGQRVLLRSQATTSANLPCPASSTEMRRLPRTRVR